MKKLAILALALFSLNASAGECEFAKVFANAGQIADHLVFTAPVAVLESVFLIANFDDPTWPKPYYTMKVAKWANDSKRATINSACSAEAARASATAAKSATTFATSSASSASSAHGAL